MGNHFLKILNHQSEVGENCSAIRCGTSGLGVHGDRRGMRTEHQDHEIPEADKTGTLVCIVTQARGARQSVCSEDMAIFCVAGEFGGFVGGGSCGGGRSRSRGFGGVLSPEDGSVGGRGKRRGVNGRRGGHLGDCRHDGRARRLISSI